MPLTDRQRLLLTSEARTWINIVVSVASQVTEEGEEVLEIARDADGDFNPKQLAKILRVAVTNVHLIAIALRQVDRHLEYLAPEWSGELAKQAVEFRDLYASSDMKDLRDVLEHSADYVADQGRNPELKEHEQPGYGLLAQNQQISGVFVFGRTYDVSPVIAAARDLLPLLPAPGST